MRMVVHTKERQTRSLSTRGLSRVPVDEIQCGEICMISGIPDINIGDTICPQGSPDPMPMLKIEEPHFPELHG